jgi:hypothetical protein
VLVVVYIPLSVGLHLFSLDFCWPCLFLSYATIISTDTAHALIDTIITLDKSIIDYIMKY